MSSEVKWSDLKEIGVDPKSTTVKDTILRYSRMFLTYREAEILYGLEHWVLRRLAEESSALYRIEGKNATTLINRVVFDEYLEQFREPPKSRKNAPHPDNQYNRAKETGNGDV